MRVERPGTTRCQTRKTARRVRWATMRAQPRHMTRPSREALSQPTPRPASPLPLVTVNRRDRVPDDTIRRRRPTQWSRIAQRHCRCQGVAQIEQKGPGELTKAQSPERR